MSRLDFRAIGKPSLRRRTALIAAISTVVVLSWSSVALGAQPRPPGDRISGPLIAQSEPGTYFAPAEAAAFPGWISITVADAAEDLEPTAVRWSLPAEDTTGPIMLGSRPGSCLTPTGAIMQLLPCGRVDQEFEWTTTAVGKSLRVVSTGQYFGSPDRFTGGFLQPVTAEHAAGVQLDRFEGTAPPGDGLVAGIRFDSDVAEDAHVVGTATGRATIEVRDAGTQRVLTTTAAEADGSFSADVPAPDAGGDYQVDVVELVDGQRTDDTTVTIPYGDAVSVDSPTDGQVVDGGPVRMRGHGEPGARITVYDAGVPVGDADVQLDGTWILTTTALPTKD